MKYIALSLFVLLCACSPEVQQIQVTAKPIDKPTLVLPKADQIHARDIAWIVLTPDNYEQVLADLSAKGQPPVIFGLTPDGYKALSLNLNDLRTYIQQQNSIITAYNNYYVRADAAMGINN